MSKKEFSSLGLSERTLSAIIKKGFEEPTDVQFETIPLMLKNDGNIIAKAKTGTGKTAAFGLPLIDMVDTSEKAIQALILTPTRELAIQVSEEINSLSENNDLKIAPIYGGQSIDQQFRRLKKGVNIVVGTPGRVIDHINRKTINLSEIKHLVFDEADEMLSMGFIDEIEEILKHTPKEKQVLLFSATMPKKIEKLATKYMGDYTFVDISSNDSDATTSLANQVYYEVKASEKFEALCRLIDFEDEFYGLVFCRTKSDVDNISSMLIDRGYDVDSIHSDVSQAQRERALNKFRKKISTILVATDVAARGIDVNDLTHVINYSIPKEAEAYIHRIGRTARAGKTGTAVTFITPSEYRRLLYIQSQTKSKIKKEQIPKVEEILKSRKKKLTNEYNEMLFNAQVDDKYYTWAKKLLSYHQPTEILATVLQHSLGSLLDASNYAEINETLGRGDAAKERDREESVRLFVALGKKDGITVKKLINRIIGAASVKSKDINQVEVLNQFSFITVPNNKVDRILTAFHNKGNRNKPLITIAKENKR